MILVTPPAIEPVTLAEIKRQCVVDSYYDDVLLDAYGLAARQHVETLCGPLITQSWIQYLQSWPFRMLEIGKPRLQEIESIKYTDSDAIEHALSESVYLVNTVLGRVMLADGQSWPTGVLHQVNPIAVTFACGYGDDPGDIPEPIRIAILMLCSHWYENREPVNIGNTVTPLPFAVDALLENYRHR